MQDESASAPVPPAALERRLASILMADVVGYSRTMGDDEEPTIGILSGHREVFDALLKQHRGRTFNTAGDSILAGFPSAVEAVRCATEAQAALRTRDDHLPPEQRMRFRIGINLGDVVVQGGDLLGDGLLEQQCSHQRDVEACPMSTDRRANRGRKLHSRRGVRSRSKREPATQPSCAMRAIT